MIMKRRAELLEEHIRRRAKGSRDGYALDPYLESDRNGLSIIGSFTFSLSLYFFLRPINCVMNYFSFICDKIKIQYTIGCHICAMVMFFWISFAIVAFVDLYGLGNMGSYRLGPKRKCAKEIIGLCFALISSLVSTLCFEDINYSYGLMCLFIHVQLVMMLLFNILDIGFRDILLEAILQIFVIKLPIF